MQLGTPALILDVELPDRRTGHDPGSVRVPGVRLSAGWRGRRSAPTGAERSLRSWSCWGPARTFTVTDAVPGTRFLLMAGKPYGEVPVFNGPYVD